jgi:hypothetical protein
MILTTIDGMPLYSTSPEAVAHAIRIGLQGYHTHVFRGRVGYMAGVNHQSMARRSQRTNTTSVTPVTQPVNQPVTRPSTARTSSNTNSSNNSGGGY